MIAKKMTMTARVNPRTKMKTRLISPVTISTKNRRKTEMEEGELLFPDAPHAGNMACTATPMEELCNVLLLVSGGREGEEGDGGGFWWRVDGRS